jgi:hypothetical protein
MGDKDPSHEQPKLPQARMYLKSAQWGFDELLAKKLSDYPFRFYLIGILATLRAVQHVLKNHDSTLSDEHKRVIDEWFRVTPTTTPELNFIRTSRNSILKGGDFEGYATVSEIATGEGPDCEIATDPYDLAYYDDAGERHDLEEKLRGALCGVTEN